MDYSQGCIAPNTTFVNDKIICGSPEHKTVAEQRFKSCLSIYYRAFGACGGINN